MRSSDLHHWDDVIAKVYRMLKPGGVFVSSTACIGDTMAFLKFILPIVRVLGFVPFVRVFKKKELENSLTNAGFKIDYNWQPGRGKAVFIVARKPS